ncbi:MAG: helix-turn-helix domain-containing protein [Rickettsiales bacterium]
MTLQAQHPVDVYVGGRLRLRRVMLGLSQQELGNAVGITFQQVQKYEKGMNRIGASRLFDLSRALHIGVEYFFEDMPPDDMAETAEGPVALHEPLPPYDEEGGDDLTPNDFGRSNKDVLLLIRYYQNIKDAEAKKRTLSLVRGISQLYDKNESGSDERDNAETVRDIRILENV